MSDVPRQSPVLSFFLLLIVPLCSPYFFLFNLILPYPLTLPHDKTPPISHFLNVYVTINSSVPLVPRSVPLWILLSGVRIPSRPLVRVSVFIRTHVNLYRPPVRVKTFISLPSVPLVSSPPDPTRSLYLPVEGFPELHCYSYDLKGDSLYLTCSLV